MIKSTANKTDFSDQTLAQLARFGAVGVTVQSTGFDVAMVIERQDLEPVTVQLVKARTTYGADATAEKWNRWAADLLPVPAAAPVEPAFDRPPQPVISEWARTRQGWTVFFIRAYLEGGQVAAPIEIRGYIDRAGLDGHILVHSMTQGAGSIPLHLVINSGFDGCGFSTPYANAAGGAPVMGYAVIDPDTPETVIDDVLVMHQQTARALLVETARAELAAEYAALPGSLPRPPGAAEPGRRVSALISTW